MNLKFLLLLFLCCVQLSFSQDCIYTEFGMNDGLPSSQTYDLHQDKNGVIWYASDRGLANYNGYEFKTFGIKDGILNQVVLDFYPQENGKIYCATLDNELFYFEEKFNGFTPYTHNSILKQELPITYQHINNLYIDTKGSFHISTDYAIGKLVISKDGKILERPAKIEKRLKHWMTITMIDTNVPFSTYTLEDKSDGNTISCSMVGANKNEAITLRNNTIGIFKDFNNIYIVDQHGNTIKTIQTDKMPITVKKVDEHHFFTGYFYGGGVIRDIDGNVVDHFLKNKSVSNFLIDHDGGYWFSTLHSGVFYAKEPRIKFVQTSVDSPIWTLTKDEIDLYIGYSTGEVFKLDTNYACTPEQKLANNNKAFVEYDTINKELYVRSGTLFYKKGKDNIRKYMTDSVFRNYAVKLSEPSERGLIIANISEFTILESEHVKMIETNYRVEDAAFWKDEVYFGTSSGVFNYKNDSIHAMKTFDSIFENRVDDIDVDEKENKIYFATLGAGLIIYDKNTEQIQHITTQDGLSNDIINELYIGNKDELWVCTNSGLNKIKFTENNAFEITGLKSTNGLLNDGISDVEIINDTVWIASRKGLMVAPKQLFDIKKATNSYYLRVKACYVNDTIATLEKLKNLSHEENRIEFMVQGISFKASNGLMYKYKMEGLDTKWYYTNNRKISYPSLPYGEYTLKVAATTLQQEENLTFITIPIHITAPFWKQAWFIISVIFAIGLLIFLFFKYRILSYNRHIIREILRLIVKKIKRKEKYFNFKEAGKEIRIQTDTILYVKSSGNYIELVTETKHYTIRKKIGEFIDLMPDPLEYIRIHRSYIIRIDKVAEKNTKEVTIHGEKLPVSNSYVEELNNLFF